MEYMDRREKVTTKTAVMSAVSFRMMRKGENESVGVERGAAIEERFHESAGESQIRADARLTSQRQKIREQTTAGRQAGSEPKGAKYEEKESAKAVTEPFRPLCFVRQVRCGSSKAQFCPSKFP